MKRTVLAFLLFAASALPALGAPEQSVPEQTAGIVTAATQDAGQTRSQMAQERQSLQAEKRTLQTSIAQKQNAFGELKKEYDALLAREQALQEELAAQAHELKTIDGTIRTSAKQARDYFHESLTTPEFPERMAALDTILTPETFPGLEGIRTLLTLYLEEMSASGQILLREGAFISADGTEIQGNLARIGTFTMAYRQPDGTMGFLRPAQEGTRLSAVQGAPGWGLSRTMKAYFAGESSVFPVDISNGAALARLSQDQKGVLEWLQTGGLLVWPILLVGVIALGLVIERFYSLSRIRGNSDRNMQTILRMVQEGKWQECRDFCREKSEFPTCRIIGHTLTHLGATREIIENAFQEGLLKELPRLERFLPTLGVLAAIAPLLGLLGTVTGMINTFQIITLYGTGDPRMMSGGISEALITTQLGLVVAVPIMLLHHVLERRVDGIIGDMEEKGTGFAVALMKQGLIKTGSQPAPAAPVAPNAASDPIAHPGQNAKGYAAKAGGSHA